MNIRVRCNGGFSLVEAVVSLAILSTAIATFLATMHSATLVSNEEFAETDVQTKGRLLLDGLEKDLTNARVVFLPNLQWGPSSVGPKITTMVDPVAGLQPITFSDPDGAPVWLLMKYQVPLVNMAVTAKYVGSLDATPTAPNSYENYCYTGAYYDQTTGKTTPRSWGAYGSGDPTGVPGACYDIVFKQIKIVDEAPYGVSYSPPASSPNGIGVNLIQTDAFMCRYIIGEIQLRFEVPIAGGTGFYDGWPGYPNYTAGATAIPTIGALQKVYAGRAIMKYDMLNNSLMWNPMYDTSASPQDPADAMFYWLEYPGKISSTLWEDGNFHPAQPSNVGSPQVIGQCPATGQPPPSYNDLNGWKDENFNGLYDPILCLQLRFLEGNGSALRMKRYTTRIYMNNQRTD